MSDIHGSHRLLEKALAAFEREQADAIAFLGDALYHGPRNPIPDAYDPKITAAILNRYKDKMMAVRGNCDSEVDQMMIDYPMLSSSAFIFIDGRRIYLTHGHVFNPDNLPPLGRGDILAFGHSHVPMAEKRNRIYMFNPGSVSLPKENYPPSYGMIANGRLRVNDLDGEILMDCPLI